MIYLTFYSEIFISPRELKRTCILNKKIIVSKKSNVLLTGKIVDEYNNPIIDAVIVIEKINSIDYEQCMDEICYSKTNDNGEYAIVLECSPSINYKLQVYRPIIKDTC